MSFQSTDSPYLPRAAQYVRMSTDHQQYSIENQIDAIATYAEKHELKIIRTYADEGRSGLRLESRKALQSLLADVRSGHADFDTILVYDVSRWGRFQDADESAYYEFVCKEAGIKVIYCAEQFENDGSLVSTVIKNIKRAMAAEYSRELSTKVFIGQCRIVKMGFWRGGPASYGLRRHLLDEHGVPKFSLESGQWKNLQNDRVVLRPGPPSEVEVVKRVFNSFTKERKRATDIARELNAEGLVTARGNPWSGCSVDILLSNELYIGNVVVNRSSYKLQQRRIYNPPEMWIRRNDSLQGIIAPDVFAKAQKLLERRRQRMSNEEALKRLKALWLKKGHLSANVIDPAKGVPCVNAFRDRFGSISAVYKLIGYPLAAPYQHEDTRTKIRTIIASVARDIGLCVERQKGRIAFNDTLRIATVDDRITVVIAIAWVIFDRSDEPRRWRIIAKGGDRCDLGLLIRMDRTNSRPEEYFLLPTRALMQAHNHAFRISNRTFLKAFRLESLDAFYEACLRRTS
jgi:DNA invertase Pin-like site-specific DNA recombinase